MTVWGLTNSCEKKRSEKQRRKGKIYPSQCRVPKNSKERWENHPQRSVQKTEEKHRMGKTRDLFKKIRDTKGTFLTKMGTMKGRNCMYLTEEIKKRWQEYTEELHKKDLHDPDNYDGVITHLEPDILECKAKRALGSIIANKASGGDGIPVELFQILKDESAAHNMPANLENSAVATGLEKVSFHSNPRERQCQRIFKLPHNCSHLTC